VAHRHAVAVHSEPADTTTGAETAVDAEEPQTALDPVCGMTVALLPDTLFSDAGGHRHWFCSAGCRSRFETDAARTVATEPPASTSRPAEAL
jgi:xanthine dehydrogenase accessory factor